MAFENIERRFQRWKVIMVPGAKSYYRRDSPVSRISPREGAQLRTGLNLALSLKVQKLDEAKPTV